MIQYHIFGKKPAPKAQARKQPNWLNRYWFQIFLGLICLHMFFNREISVQVQVRAPGVEDTSVKPVSLTKPVSQARVSQEPAEFSSGSGLFSFWKKRPEPECLRQENRGAADRHIQRFSKVAMAEMKKFGVPASIILAHSLLASHSGQNPVAQNLNNYFLLPCIPDLPCQTVEISGRDYHFRPFSNAWESFREYSLMFQQPDMKHVHELGIHQYKRWAKALQKHFAPSDNDFDEAIIQVIETLNLTRFDQG
jgi:flagellum-specific peptidoglycan hydrolase FlgJ